MKNVKEYAVASSDYTLKVLSGRNIPEFVCVIMCHFVIWLFFSIFVFFVHMSLLTKRT